jgi:hypothetical protein
MNLNPAFITKAALFGLLFSAACGGSGTATENEGAGGRANGGAGAASGHGGTGSGAPATSTKSPCELLTRAQAEAAVGQPLPQNDENTPLGMCDYNAADFSAGASLTLGGWTEIKAAATGGNGVPVAISGVGDEALNLNGSNGSLLYVRRQSQGFLLVLNGPTIDHAADHGLAQEEGLAREVLANF